MAHPEHTIVSEQLEELSAADLAALQRFVPDSLGPTQDPEAMVEHLPEIIGAEDAALFVARNPEGEVVGAMVANISYCMAKRRGRIDDVAVDEKWRRRGYAATLLDDVIAWFQERGVQKIELISEDDATAAHALYRSRGFEVRDINVFELKF